MYKCVQVCVRVCKAKENFNDFFCTCFVAHLCLSIYSIIIIFVYPCNARIIVNHQHKQQFTFFSTLNYTIIFLYWCAFVAGKKIFLLHFNWIQLLFVDNVYRDYADEDNKTCYVLSMYRCVDVMLATNFNAPLPTRPILDSFAEGGFSVIKCFRMSQRNPDL